MAFWDYQFGDQNGYAYMVIFKLENSDSIKRARVCNWTHPAMGGKEEAVQLLLKHLPNAVVLEVK